jgi:flagellar biosynthesis protein FlhG
MADQAYDLRQLIRDDPRPGGDAAAERFSSSACPATLIVVAGGKGGVGTTTVAVNLAISLAQKGRTLLIDAATRGNAAVQCGIEERYTLADVLASWKRMPEAIQIGPAKLLVLAGNLEAGNIADSAPAVAARLLDHLHDLPAQTDFVVLDAGNGLHPLLRGIWRIADRVLMVTSPQPASILGTFATIKWLVENEHPRLITTLVNMAANPAAANTIHARLAQTSLRFLGVHLEAAGYLPFEKYLTSNVSEGKPLVIAKPHCMTERQVNRLANWAAKAAEKQNLHALK